MRSGVCFIFFILPLSALDVQVAELGTVMPCNLLSNSCLEFSNSSVTCSRARFGTRSRDVQGCLQDGQQPLAPLLCRKRLTQAEQNVCEQASSTGPWKKSPQISQRRWLSISRWALQSAGHSHSSFILSPPRPTICIALIEVKGQEDTGLTGQGLDRHAAIPTLSMANSLTALDAQLAQYLIQLQTTYQKKSHFQPTFWLQQTEFDAAREVFAASMGAIGHTVTKFSLVYSNSPGNEEGASICEALRKSCEQLLAATNFALFCGAGPSLATEIRNDAIRLIKSIQVLTKELQKTDLARVPQLTGRCVTMLNSTINELKDFLAEQKDDEGQAVALDEVEQDNEFGFESSLTEDERALFESGLKLLSMCATIMKRGVLTIKNLTILNSQDVFLKWTARLDVSYTAAQDVIVDFGAALYPPIGTEELTEAVNELSGSAVAILTCLKEMPELSSAEENALSIGEAAFVKQVATVKSQIEAS
ncbi:hypothetical protein CCR75_004312 [Bremia lactucae]|uniref:Secreted RxLR effector n=1 Tax=Bremia lactucae TaxID=4779 RepID=A0A976FLL8_BRELC|nr:hypothetical protein CCR75_004312 [Bremia lactucae]